MTALPPAADASPADPKAARATVRRRRPAELHLLRPVPGRSPLHRMWAGTKLLAAAGISLALTVAPTWPAVLVVALVLALALAVAGVPRGAAPKLPRWFYGALLVSGALAVIGGGGPTVELAGISLGLGGLEVWARFMALGVAVVVAAMLVSWTTSPADIAPAVRTLLSPLGWIRLPVDAWAATIALAIRCLPLLLDELRTVAAARRLRPPAAPSRRGGRFERYGNPLELLLAVLVVAIRRARELGEAIEVRGGLGPSRGPKVRLRGGDIVVLVLVAVGLAAALASSLA